MTCPDPDTLAGFVDDTLVPGARLTVEHHVDECDDCRAAVAMLTRAAREEHAVPQTLPEPDAARAPDALLPTVPATPGGAPPDTLVPGTRVGRYVIGERLGAGGMGVVYLATDPDLGREVAIKILRRAAGAEPTDDGTRRIVREAQALARIAHPNVVAVYDVGTFDGQVFIAMERVRGASLRAWLTRRARTPAEIVEVFSAAGRGLAAAHDAGIVHRDFKPDNVLVGDDGRARVVDFGLARHDDADEPLAIAGTPAYMAPEQRADGNVDPRTDEYSFCVALYEALHGHRPATGEARDDRSSRVPASLHAIVVRGLAAAPGDRFPTMDALLRALGRDRARAPRLIATAAAIALAIVLIALGADWILRERARAVTRTGFEAARAQLVRLLHLRTETFVAQSDAINRLPALQEVAATHDLVEFGLGDAPTDRARLEHIHENLRSADWVALAKTRAGDVLAIADEKGRLLFDTAAPDAWGNDVTGVPAIAQVYGGADTAIGVVHAGETDVIASGLLGATPRAALYVVFARAKRVGDRPRAAFVQLVDAARLLGEVDVGDGTLLAVVDPAGHAEGAVPPGLLGRASDDRIAEVAEDGGEWLVQRAPLRAADQQDAIAELVLARRTDIGLSGLFPNARLTLALLAALLGLTAVAGAALARRRDLSRRRA